MSKLFSDQKQQIIDTWKTKESPDYAYFNAVEDQVAAFWDDGTVFRRLFDKLDLRYTVEIACGRGRHSEHIVEKCEKLTLIDTSIDAIDEVRNRFSGKANVFPVLSTSGDNLDGISSESTTAVFSYDAMVHFELLTMAAYFSEISRILVPGGQALLHHSIYDEHPENNFSKNPGWRNFMSPKIIVYLASRSGLSIVETVALDWSAPHSDQLTLLKKA